MSRERRRAAVLAALAALTGACATSLPETHYYTLRPPRTPAVAASAAGVRVGVETFSVDPPYDQDRLVFRRREERAKVGFYAYHRWASSLGRLAAVAFAEGLAGAPGVAAIEPAASGGDYDLLLGGRLLYLEEVDRESTTEGRIAVTLTLLAADRTPVWSDTIEASARGPAAGGEQVAELLQRAFDKALDDARARLAAALAAITPAPADG